MKGIQMEHQYVDLKSVWGSIIAFIFGGIGIFTLNEWATIIAMVAGILTIIHSIMKIVKELKKK